MSTLTRVLETPGCSGVGSTPRIGGKSVYFFKKLGDFGLFEEKIWGLWIVEEKIGGFWIFEENFFGFLDNRRKFLGLSETILEKIGGFSYENDVFD